MSEITRKYLDDMAALMAESKLKDFYKKMSSLGAYYNQEEDKALRGSLYDIKMRQCFKNSLLMALANDELEYVEGYYVTDVIDLPLEHAWNFNRKTRKVADYTSTKFDFVVKERFGVFVPKEILGEYVSSKYNGIISPLQYCNITNKGIFEK